MKLEEETNENINQENEFTEDIDGIEFTNDIPIESDDDDGEEGIDLDEI